MRSGIVVTGLEEEDPASRVLTESCGERASSRAGADHDHVVGVDRPDDGSHLRPAVPAFP